MADRERKGREKKGTFIWDHSQEAHCRRGRLGDCRQKWREWGSGLFNITSMQTLPVNAGKLKTQNLALEMRHTMERDLPTFLSPSSQQSPFLLGLLQKSLGESLGDLSCLYPQWFFTCSCLKASACQPTSHGLCDQYIDVNP